MHLRMSRLNTEVYGLLGNNIGHLGEVQYR
jgi:hypothetical protein